MPHNVYRYAFMYLLPIFTNYDKSSHFNTTIQVATNNSGSFACF